MIGQAGPTRCWPQSRRAAGDESFGSASACPAAVEMHSVSVLLQSFAASYTRQLAHGRAAAAAHRAQQQQEPQQQPAAVQLAPRSAGWGGSAPGRTSTLDPGRFKTRIRPAAQAPPRPAPRHLTSRDPGPGAGSWQAVCPRTRAGGLLTGRANAGPPRPIQSPDSSSHVGPTHPPARQPIRLLRHADSARPGSACDCRRCCCCCCCCRLPPPPLALLAQHGPRYKGLGTT